MIIAVELFKARRELYKYVVELDNGHMVLGEELMRVDAKLKEIMDEIERRENASGCGEQSRETRS